jgi:hypothetical protein
MGAVILLTLRASGRGKTCIGLQDGYIRAEKKTRLPASSQPKALPFPRQREKGG